MCAWGTGPAMSSVGFQDVCVCVGYWPCNVVGREDLPARTPGATPETPIIHAMGFKLLYYRIWIRDVFWLGRPGTQGAGIR